MASKQQIDQWIASQGGPNAVSYGYEDVDVDNPAFNNPDHPNYEGRTKTPDKIKTRRETWTNKTTGATYSAVRTPYASDVFQDIKETPGTKANTTGQRTQPEGTPDPSKPSGFDNDHPIMVTRGPDRQVIESRPLTAPERAQWEKDNGRAPGQTARQDVPGHPGIVHVVSKDANGNTDDHYEDAQGNRVAAPTDVKPTPTQDGAGNWGYWDNSSGKPVWTPIQGGPAGKKYSDVKQDPDSKKWWGLTPDGKWEEMSGGPGSASASQGAGPPLPELILGHSQDALRAYRQSLQVEVDTKRHTQAWADARWKEALEVAQHTINEATILHADQQSNMNASINLANSRLTVANSGFNAALDFVSKMKTGDSSGGAAFGALLTLQLANAQRAGAYNNIVPGSQGSMEGRGVGDATASTFATTNDQLTRLTAPPASASAAAVAAPAPTPEPASSPSASPPPPSEPVIPPSAPVTPAAAPAPSAAVAVPPPTPGEPGGPPLQPGPVWTPPAAQAAPPVSAPAWAPDYGAPDMSVLPGVVSPAPVAPEPTPEAPPEEMVTIRNRVTGATMTLPRSKWNSTWTLGIWQEVPPEAPAPASPDVRTNAPYNEDPSQGPVTQAPYADWAVMAKALPSQQSVTPAFNPSSTPAPDAMPYSILHSQAASRPWWRMTPEEEERYRAAGVPEETIRSNGRTVAV